MGTSRGASGADPEQAVAVCSIGTGVADRVFRDQAELLFVDCDYANMIDIITWLKERFVQGAAKAKAVDLPAILHPYVDEIERTRLPIIGADVEDDTPHRPDGSQLGGLPWWPEDRDLPVNDKGKPLFLLAQLNLSDLPRFEPLPSSGLMQFFIGTDDLYGADFDNPTATSGFRCIYHKTVEGPYRRSFDGLKMDDHACLPLEEPLRARRLTFFEHSMTVDLADYRFAKLAPALNAAMSEDDALFDAYSEWCSAPPIRLGGYPSFTQEDPRAYKDGRTLGDFNLLTIETTIGIMWGDVGIAQFLCHEDDIRREDVSKVIYNWDCH